MGIHKYILLGVLAAAVLGMGGCKTGLGGPEIDNKSNTYPNQIEKRNLNTLSNPAPNESSW